MSSQEQDEAAINPGMGKSTRILVVDDDIPIQALLTEVLTEEAYDVVTASNCEEAIDLLNGDEVDVVITDLVMPGRSGIEVVRAAKRIDPQRPVIVITGYPSVDTAVRLIDLGVADYIAKPFNVDLIKVTVAKVLARKKALSRVPEPGDWDQLATIDGTTGTCNFALFYRLLENEVEWSFARDRVCSLLMVEIDAVERDTGGVEVPAAEELLKILAKILGREKRPGDIIGRTDHREFSVIMRETAASEAWALGQKVGREARPHLTLTTGVASAPADALDARHLVVAAHRSARALRERSVSRRGHLSVDVRELGEPIQGTIRDPADPQVADPTEGGMDREVVDSEAILARFGGDDDLLRALADIFLENSPKVRRDLQEAIANDDCRGLELAAHSLRGSAGHFSARSACEAAHRLEMIGRSGDLAGAREEAAALELEVGRLEATLTLLVDRKVRCES